MTYALLLLPMFPILIQNVKGNQQCVLMNNYKRVAVKPPRKIEREPQHVESISIMPSEVHANHNADNNPSNNNIRVAVKHRNSDNNKDNGCSCKTKFV